MHMTRIQKLLGCLALAAATVTGAYAQTYPTKPIYLYIPFAAGGPTDTLGRNLAQVMGKPLKQQIIVENVVGAGGTIGVARAAKAAPDGYTVLLHHIGMSTATALYRTLTSRNSSPISRRTRTRSLTRTRASERPRTCAASCS